MKILTFVLTVLIPYLGSSQNRMTPELLWKIKRVNVLGISPDKTQILLSIREYSLENNNSKSDLYVLPVKGGKLTQITQTDAHEVEAQWRPDGKKIAFLATTDKGMNIVEINPDGTGLMQVSSVDGGMDGFKYAPTMTKILFIREVKTTKVSGSEIHSDLPNSNARIYDDLMYRHWDSWEDGSHSHIFVAPFKDGQLVGQGTDIMPNQAFDAPMKPMGGMEQITWTNDAVNIVYSCKKKAGMKAAISTNSEIYFHNTLLSSDNNFTVDNHGYDLNPAFSPDGKKVAWQSMERDGNEAAKNDIIVYDYATKLKTNITKTHDLTVGSFCWGADAGKIYFLSVKEAAEQFFEIDVTTGSLRQITTGDHDFVSIAFAGDYLIGGRQDMNRPTEIFQVNIKTGEQKQLTDVNADIYQNLEIGQIEKRWVNTTDGKKELVWVIYPPGFDKTKKYPALLYCQGGPQSPVSQFFSFRWNFQLMAANDYIIVAPNRRGLPGFGQAWNDQISGDWGGQAIDDYLSAIDSIAKEPYVDETRIGAIGASYGGYSVYYLAGMHKKRFKCFISHCGLFNLESWYGTTEEIFFANQDVGGPYYFDIKKKAYEKNSPHKMVKDWDTPMLIFHGEKDYRVPVTQAMEAFQACKILGIDARLITFPEENHFVLQPQNGILWHREFYAWLDKYLK